MPKNNSEFHGAYKVDYHAIQAVYFGEERVLSGPELAEIWSGTRMFGDETAIGAFWHGDGEVPEKLPQFQLGSMELVAPLLARGPHPIYGGGMVSQKHVARDSTLDADFYFAHSERSRWGEGETVPSLLFSVSGQWVERVGVDSLLQCLKKHFELVDRHAPLYGLIDLARSEDAFAGMAYVSSWIQRIPLQRWVEQGDWVYWRSKRGDRARGIYWGNYFGPQILARLGGRTQFANRYREKARFADGDPDAHIWEFENGVFVSLCLDPLGCKPGEPLDFSAMFNLRWLHKELVSNGVLGQLGEQT
jgi:hypothetical protein